MKKNPTGLDTADPRRYMRAYMARRRKSKSWKTFAEDAAVLCALAAGEVTTSAAAKVLGLDIVGVRERLAEFVAVGIRQVGKQLEGRIAELKKELAKVNGAKA